MRLGETGEGHSLSGVRERLASTKGRSEGPSRRSEVPYRRAVVSLRTHQPSNPKPGSSLCYYVIRILITPEQDTENGTFPAQREPGVPLGGGSPHPVQSNVTGRLVGTVNDVRAVLCTPGILDPHIKSNMANG